MKGLSIRKKTVLLTVVIIVITSILSFIAFTSIKRAKVDADILNLLGRQRMLSQEMAKHILGYVMAKNTLKKSEDEVRNLNSYISEMREAYTKTVIAPAGEVGLAISMSPEKETHPAIPFPATLTRIVNENFGGKGNFTI